MATRTFVFINKDIVENDINIHVNEIGLLKRQNKVFGEILLVSNCELITLSTNDYELFDIRQTGDGYLKKVCNVCNRLLPTENFQKNQNGKDNRSVRRPSCNDCRTTIDGVHVPPHERRQWFLTKPDLVPFKCPICKKITVPGLTSKVVLDHDHSTGRVRGWICDSCNTGLGRFKDNVELLKQAITYLETN